MNDEQLNCSKESDQRLVRVKTGLKTIKDVSYTQRQLVGEC